MLSVYLIMTATISKQWKPTDKYGNKSVSLSEIYIYS